MNSRILCCVLSGRQIMVWIFSRLATMQTSMILVFLAVLAAILPLTRKCEGQVVDPITMAQAPVPGAGHHYIGTGTETVNPADGSVTFDLPIQTPPGRGLSFPFGIHYSESEPFYLTNNGVGKTFEWATPASEGQLAPFDLNGWSYQLPNYQAQAFLANTQTGTSGCSGYPNCSPNYCWGTQNYSFSGFDGRKHPLAMADLWVSQNSTQPQLDNVCQASNYSGLGGGVSRGGDNGIATGPFGTIPTSLEAGTQPPFSVSERSGTVYQFPLGPLVGGGTQYGPLPFGVLAQSITDRNGNQIVLNGTATALGGNNANNSPIGGILPSGSYTDTLGRPIVSWTGLAGTTSQGTLSDQLNIYGLGPITVNWTTTPVTFPDQAQNSTCVYVTAPYTTCGFGSSQRITIAVVGAIILPNGQQYGFTYGDSGPCNNGNNNNWGRLSKITFPDGGYVRYCWGTNSKSKATYQTWPLDQTIPFSGGTATAWAEVDTPAITDRYVSYDGTTEALHQTFGYGTSWNANPSSGQLATWSSKTTTVTSYDQVRYPSGTVIDSVTTYTYASIGAFLGPNDTPQQASGANPVSWQAPQVPVESTVLYQDGSANTLKTVNKTWLDQYQVVADQTIEDNGQSTATLRCVDGLDRVENTFEYDFQSAGSSTAPPSCTGVAGTVVAGPINGASTNNINRSVLGPLARKTTLVFHTFNGTDILDEPDSVTVADGNGNMVKQTSYVYDQGTPTASNAATGLVTAPGGAVRGNPTSVSRWLNTSTSPVTSTYAYFDTGNVKSITDPCGNGSCADMGSQTNHTTTYAYADSYSSCSGAAPPNGLTAAYLTQVTNPLGQTRSFCWDYSKGLLMSSTDENQQTTKYKYNDPLDRLKEVDYPDGGQTSVYYNDSTFNASNNTPNYTVTTRLTSQQDLVKETAFDGLGHTVRTILLSDPSGSDSPLSDYVDTAYDGLGRVYTVTNPYRATSDPTYGLTQYTYDAIGRKTNETNPDGSAKSWCYDGLPKSQSNCNGHLGSQPAETWVDSTDELGNDWQRTTNGLGQMIEVMEPNGTSQAPGMETDYTYDLLNDLVSVTQWGGAQGSSGARTRSFIFDSLSRLSKATNPETGTVGYTYDLNGNVQAKSDARGITTSFTYDVLNRVVSKSYTGDPSNTPLSCFQYDTSSATCSQSNANWVGRLTNAWTQSASTASCSTAAAFLTKRLISCYDPMGRILKEQQYTPATQSAGTPYSPSYSYDFAGNLLTSTAGVGPASASPVTLTGTFDGAARLRTLTSNWTNGGVFPATLFSPTTSQSNTSCTNLTAQYWPFGGLMNAQFGNGLNLNRSYDIRLRTNCETDIGGGPSASTPGSATVTITGAEQTQ